MENDNVIPGPSPWAGTILSWSNHWCCAGPGRRINLRWESEWPELCLSSKPCFDTQTLPNSNFKLREKAVSGFSGGFQYRPGCPAVYLPSWLPNKPGWELGAALTMLLLVSEQARGEASPHHAAASFPFSIFPIHTQWLRLWAGACNRQHLMCLTGLHDWRGASLLPSPVTWHTG